MNYLVFEKYEIAIEPVTVIIHCVCVRVGYMIYVCLGYMFPWLVCLSMHVSMVGGEGDVNSMVEH